MTIKVIIGGKDYTKHTILPIKWNALLNERLDEARLSLRQTPKHIFDIGALVEIQITQSDKTHILNFIISADTSTEIPPGSKNYNHELCLIEPTKMLEGIVVETLTFKNPLGRAYASNPIKAVPQYE